MPVTMRDGRWWWRGALVLMTLTLAMGSALVVALTLGWNNPRPARLPDWQADAFPIILEARSNETTVMLLTDPGSDFILEVEAVPLSDSDLDGYGLVYRAQDDDHYYAFAVGSDGYYAVLRAEDSEETELVDWQQFPHIHRGRQSNQLRVACAGQSCRFYINDEYAATVEDDTWLAGDAGLWGHGLDLVVQFLDARLWSEGDGGGLREQ